MNEKTAQTFDRTMTKNILLTGGAGYIGSHTWVALNDAGFHPVILDDFSNSSPQVLDRLHAITERAVVCERGNVGNIEFVREMILRHRIDAVIHFAGFKAVGESVAHPLKYYANNVGGMMGLLHAMDATGCRTLVFSSSATVYGDPATVPVAENFPRTHASPYAHTKLVCEDVLAAMRAANPNWRIGVLRYFNPIGAHPSGLIGEHPAGTPNNLMPYVAQVAMGRLPFLNVYGNDFPTPDGTGVRDYIHVQDLASGHVAAVQALLRRDECLTLNLGSGHGHSVLEVVRTFEQASGRSIPFRYVPRRPGDVAEYYADPSLAHRLLGWRTQHSLADACRDVWRWQSSNPNGYD